MPLHILLRTVCGCERIVPISERNYPPFYKVPYSRTAASHIFWQGEDFSLDDVTYSVRTFERIPKTGLYGYPVYLEQTP